MNFKQPISIQNASFIAIFEAANITIKNTMEFDHIGLAVNNIENYFSTILKPVFGINELSEIFIDPIQKSKVAFASTVNGVRLELIEPLNEESPVYELLQKKRGGLYHLCFVATNFEKDIQNCIRQKFIPLTNPKPAIAFNNRKVIFFSTPSFEVIELIEEAS